MSLSIESKLDILQSHFEIYYENCVETLTDPKKNWLRSVDVKISNKDWDRLGDEVLYEELNKIVKENIQKKVKK